MATNTIGLLHPGAMGSSIGAAARAGGKTVWWASAGRSEQSRMRARQAGLEDAGTLDALVRRCGFVISVCPPAAAVQVASDVAEAGFTGTYLDANAISPGRSREIGETVTRNGARYIDGSIIGGPAWKSGTTWLYVSGPHASLAEECFAGSVLSVCRLDGGIGAASAIKMAYAAYTKGTKALLAAILSFADKEDVLDPLLEQWERSQKTLAEDAVDRVRTVTAKAWRFVGEMREISTAFADVGLPGGFHAAAAEVYERIAGYKDAADTPSLTDVIATVGDAD